MALTLTTAARNAICDALTAAIDGGTGAGYLEFQTASDVEAATLLFSATSFAAATGGQATANAINNDAGATGGTVDRFRIYDGDGVEILQGTVSTTGADINLNTVTISAASVVSISSLIITQPAS